MSGTSNHATVTERTFQWIKKVSCEHWLKHQTTACIILCTALLPKDQPVKVFLIALSVYRSPDLGGKNKLQVLKVTDTRDTEH